MAIIKIEIHEQNIRIEKMLRFNQSNERWWNKPLVKIGRRILPAELAVLDSIIGQNEKGAWLNSRETRTGVFGFDSKAKRTIRKKLPEKISSILYDLYASNGISKGCPDLIIWSTNFNKIKFVEVKCPHWDRPSEEQIRFVNLANKKGYSTEIIEWEYIS